MKAKSSILLCAVLSCARAPPAGYGTGRCFVNAHIAYQLDVSGSLLNFADQAARFSKTLLAYIHSVNSTAVTDGGKLDLAVVTFGGSGKDGWTPRIETLRKFESNQTIQDTVDRIERLTFYGSSPTGEGIRRVVSEFNSVAGKVHHKALILFSDGRPTLPRDDPEAEAFATKAADEAKSQGIVIYTIFVGKDNYTRAYQKSLAFDRSYSFELDSLKDEESFKKALANVLQKICHPSPITTGSSVVVPTAVVPATVPIGPPPGLTTATSSPDEICVVNAHVAFQIDTSGSVSRLLPAMKNFSVTFLDFLHDANVSAVKGGGQIDLCVVRFGPVRTLRHFGSLESMELTKKSIMNITSTGCTLMEDGIRQVLKEFGDAERLGGVVTKALVLFSDGEPAGPKDRCSVKDEAKVATTKAANEAKSRGITIYTIFIGSNTASAPAGQKFLRSIASDPSRAFDVSSFKNVSSYKKAFAQIIKGICRLRTTTSARSTASAKTTMSAPDNGCCPAPLVQLPPLLVQPVVPMLQLPCIPQSQSQTGCP